MLWTRFLKIPQSPAGIRCDLLTGVGRGEETVLIPCAKKLWQEF